VRSLPPRFGFTSSRKSFTSGLTPKSKIRFPLSNHPPNRRVFCALESKLDKPTRTKPLISLENKSGN
jgi:hypothetical protein